MPLAIRKAREADRALLFEWANDPVTRAQSFSCEIIPWEAHCTWFTTVLADPNRFLYILLAPSEEPIGQARFDRSGDREAVISVSLAPAWRGRRLAAPVIRLATDRARRDAGLALVHAYIRPGNHASRRAFATAGYDEEGGTTIAGAEAAHFVARL